ncbi:MAG TPA: hypothetical protein VGX91_08660 [Candidatus Cybelea sp.]|nr:hypothetical protein [Candidatus Cybelea sp.]
MRISLPTKAVGVAFALAALVGCAASGSQVPTVSQNASAPAARGGHLPEPSLSMIALTNREHLAPTMHADKGKSWMKPDAKNTQYLLYASDEPYGRVDVYAYKTKSGRLVGQLTGFKFPYGECLDGSGNVYIADFAAADIVEYAHGGTSPIKTISDSYGYPIGCSVDPKTGNLAVANFEGLGSTCMGGIVVYANASGSGTLYQDSDFDYYWPPGYDPQGNLYVEGAQNETGGTTGVAMIAAGGTQLVTVPLTGGTIVFPGGMQWDGHYVAATDQSYQAGNSSAIYRVSITPSEAKIFDATELTDKCYKGSVPYNDIVQPWINGTNHPFHAVVAGNLACDNRYDYWNYFKGGDPKRNISYNIAPLLSYGQTVSPLKR